MPQAQEVAPAPAPEGPAYPQHPVYQPYASGYAPYGASYGAGGTAPNGGLYGAVVPAGHPGGFQHQHLGIPHQHPSQHPSQHSSYGYPGIYGHHGYPHHYSYGDHSIVHNDRVGNTEVSARASDLRFADQETRRNNDLLLSDNFERRLRELEEPVRDLKTVCEQRVGESRELAQMLLPASTGPARADLAQIRKTNISPQYKIRMVKDLPVSTQKKLELVHELRMAEAMDGIIREREKDLKRSLVRHVY